MNFLKDKISNQKGQIIIISLMVLGTLALISTYFVSFTLTEYKIAKSQIMAAQTYYLAEAGVNEVIWKLKNDLVWSVDFKTEPGCENWSASFSRGSDLISSGSYQVQINNSDCARGQIIATSTIALSGETKAQRVVRAKVFKTIGSLTGDGAVFSGGNSENIDISSSIINVHDGNIFSNHNLNIDWASDVNIDGKALVNGIANVHWLSSLHADAICAANECFGDCEAEECPATSIPMPMVDFDSIEATSYKSRALAAQNAGQCQVLCEGTVCGTKCIYNSTEFKDILWQAGQNGTITLNNDITYVTGSIELKGGRKLVVNGILVSDGTIDIGENNCWTYGPGNKDCGYDQVTVNDPGVGKPSGIITKGKLNFGSYSSFSDISITGIVYANDEIRLNSIPNSFVLVGGILGRKVSISSLWSLFDMYLDNSIIAEGIWAGLQPPGEETPPYSPIVTIDHWEESY